MPKTALLPVVLLLIVVSIGGMLWAGLFYSNYNTITVDPGSSSYAAYNFGETFSAAIGTLMSPLALLIVLAILIIVGFAAVALVARPRRH